MKKNKKYAVMSSLFMFCTLQPKAGLQVLADADVGCSKRIHETIYPESGPSECYESSTPHAKPRDQRDP